MNSYHKYMLLYTGLQIIGVNGMLKLTERERLSKSEVVKKEVKEVVNNNKDFSWVI